MIDSGRSALRTAGDSAVLPGLASSPPSGYIRIGKRLAFKPRSTTNTELPLADIASK